VTPTSRPPPPTPSPSTSKFLHPERSSQPLGATQNTKIQKNTTESKRVGRLGVVRTHMLFSFLLSAGSLCRHRGVLCPFTFPVACLCLPSHAGRGCGCKQSEGRRQHARACLRWLPSHNARNLAGLRRRAHVRPPGEASPDDMPADCLPVRERRTAWRSASDEGRSPHDLPVSRDVASLVFAPHTSRTGLVCTSLRLLDRE